MSFKKYPRPKLLKTEKWCDSCLVTYPISYRYNGGITIDGEWYEGVEVPDPIVPKGYKLEGIGVGLQLNAIPPEACMYLEKVDPNAPKPDLTGGWSE
jgi:hypothetical protein